MSPVPRTFAGIASIVLLLLGACSTTTPRPPLQVSDPVLSGADAPVHGQQMFFATDIALGARGHIESEHFVSGRAQAYDIPLPKFGPAPLPSHFDARVMASGVPFTTRVVVRRPLDPTRFNGTVVVEWFNVTDGHDGEYVWLQAKELLLRGGYAYVGVSAQDHSVSVSATSLKQFNQARYGSLDLTDGGRFSITPADPRRDPLSYDIYAQIGRELRTGNALLPGFKVRRLIAAGMSQSGQRLSAFANHLAGQQSVFDAFLIQAAHQTLRDDLKVPVIKVLTESEARTLDGDQPDTALRRTWWVAGSSHGDATQRLGRTPLRERDLGPDHVGQDRCVAAGQPTPTRSRVPLRHVVSAALKALDKQLDTGEPAPSAPRFQMVQSGPLKLPARDVHGNALGAIRLAHMEAPTARADGLQCGNIGAWVPFEAPLLQALYPSHEAYVRRVEAAVRASVASGFVLADDAIETLDEARASLHGRGLACGPLCLSSGHYNSERSSTGLLREHTQYYAVADGGLLLRLVDDAHLALAKGDTEAEDSPARRQHHAAAAHWLRLYLAQLGVAEKQGLLTPTAAKALAGQANTLLRALAVS